MKLLVAVGIVISVVGCSEKLEFFPGLVSKFENLLGLKS